MRAIRGNPSPSHQRYQRGCVAAAVQTVVARAPSHVKFCLCSCAVLDRRKRNSSEPRTHRTLADCVPQNAAAKGNSKQLVFMGILQIIQLFAVRRGLPLEEPAHRARMITAATSSDASSGITPRASRRSQATVLVVFVPQRCPAINACARSPAARGQPFLPCELYHLLADVSSQHSAFGPELSLLSAPAPALVDSPMFDYTKDLVDGHLCSMKENIDWRVSFTPPNHTL